MSGKCDFACCRTSVIRVAGCAHVDLFEAESVSRTDGHRELIRRWRDDAIFAVDAERNLIGQYLLDHVKDRVSKLLALVCSRFGVP